MDFFSAISSANAFLIHFFVLSEFLYCLIFQLPLQICYKGKKSYQERKTVILNFKRLYYNRQENATRVVNLITGVNFMAPQRAEKTVNKWLIIAIFIAAVILSVNTMKNVAIDYNLADYLDSGTQTKVALNIIDDEFGAAGNMQVMAKNVSVETAESICEKIEKVENVLNVKFDRYDEAYYKDGCALFIIIIDGDDYSDNAKQVTADIKSVLSSYEGIEYGGTTIEKQSLQESITSEMVYILAISLCLVVAILLITSESWLEPFVLLAASGVAVLINRGTNVFLGEISYITNSIAAVLQLALSIDYSIVLLHTYRREKGKNSDNDAAMHSAIKSVVKPVSASALTTIAGLLALLFMSFRIGFDIGVVLMKGIVISAVTSVTLLPALVLLLDKPMKKLHKKAFIPKGKLFCKISLKASKAIVPAALVLTLVCGILQSGNRFIFTDTKADNTAISDIFGNNNSVALVYKNTKDNFNNEKRLTDSVGAYKTTDGKSVLTDYSAYTNTVRELYDVEKAAQKLELSKADAELLFTMYNLYFSPADIKMTFAEFVDFSCNLINTDSDAKEFIDDDTSNTLEAVKLISEVASDELTAEELHEKLTGSDAFDMEIDPFLINQIYGMYFYDDAAEKTVDFKTMLDFIVKLALDENSSGMFDEKIVEQIEILPAGIEQFEAQMEMNMDKTALKAWFYQNCGKMLPDEQLTRVFRGYFAEAGEDEGETVQFLPLMNFLAENGQLTEKAAEEIGGYCALYETINSNYGYEQFIPALSKAASALSESDVNIHVADETVQQAYIMCFYENESMPQGKMSGKTFAEYVLSEDESNTVVRERLTDENRCRLADMLTVSRYCTDATRLTYKTAYETFSVLQSEIKSDITSSVLEEDKIAGVYIKYAVNNGKALTSPVMACELLDFVSGNMDTNLLLKQRMTDSNRKRVDEAQTDMKKANDLFCGENYSRLLFSVNLPNESEDASEFVAFLSDEVKSIFGEDAYITGEIVTVCDLEDAFGHDNAFITVFTLASIFVIIMLIFKSLSMPVILVAIIQSAIFITMSTQLYGNGIFFMSYIVTTCILMGATIDYGILMSSNYVADRADYDKTKSLEMSVEAAVPTVFTSGLILTVCGFVIHFISSQNSISTVGLLLGIGTLCSTAMVTVVLPSVLYLLDDFVLKLSLKKKVNRQS